MPAIVPRILETRSLRLRQFTLGDAPVVQRLADDPEIARWTFIPHPYEDGIAEDWISSHAKELDQGTGVTFAVTLKPDLQLVGAIALMKVNAQHRNAELGYWVAREHQGNGYATEAGRAALDFGFKDMDLHRIHCFHFAGNNRSGRVMRKLGMTVEGRMKDYILRNGRYLDAVLYGIINPAHRD